MIRAQDIRRVVVLWVALLPAAAWAESDFARLNSQGQQAYQDGHYPEAATLLQQAYAIKPVPALLFNIARAYERVGNEEQAIRFYQRYLDAQGTDVETVKKAARALDLLRARGADEAIAKAKADQEKAAADKAAADQAAADKAADQAAADKAAADAAAGHKDAANSADAPKPAAPAAAVAPPPRPSLIPGVVLTSVGVAAAGVGVGFGVAAQGSVNSFNATFDRTRRPSLKQSAQDQAHLADGFYAGGIVAGGVGIALLIHALTADPSPAPAGPTAMLSPHGAQVAWSGSW